MAALEAVGQIDIDPPLVEEERDAFALLTRPSRLDVDEHPDTPCGWTVSEDGDALHLDDADTLDDAVGWLRYAVRVLSEAGAHRLRGLVAAHRPDDGEIFTLRVTSQRRVHGKVLRAGRGRRARSAPVHLAPVIDLEGRRRGR